MTTTLRRRCVLFMFMLVVGLLPGRTAWAQQVYVAQDIKHDTSRPMRDILRDLPDVSFGNAPYAVPNRFEPFGEQKGRLGEGPDTPDALLQETNGPLAATVGVNVQGLSEDDNFTTLGTRIVPPDVNGDVGVDYYVQYINSIWAVYDKTNGALFSGPSPGNSFWNGFGGVCETNNDGDPIVLYDHLAGRWVFSQFSINQGIQCVAVSTTGDPLGPYHRYAFVVTPGGQNDYPKMGLFTDGAGQSAYTFTLRDFGGAGGSFSVSAGVFERDAMLTGASASFVKFINPCVVNDCIEGQLPPHLEGPPPPTGTCPTYFTYVDSAYDDTPTADGARNHTLCVDWGTPANSTYNENALAASLSNFDRFLGNGFSDCIGPVLGGEVLDCLAAFTMYRAQYRWWNTYASVMLNTTVDAGADRAGIRWGELRSTDGESGWGFHQEGTFAPADGNERWMGSVAMNGDGDIALGYSVAGPSLFPAVRAAGQTAAGGGGVFDVAEFSIHEGTGAQTGSANRWGDYSSLSIDPVDNQTFWYTQEYYGTTSSFNFKTRIASFTLFPEADLAVTKTDDTDPVVAGETLTYTVTVTNNGPDDATGVVVTETLPAGVSSPVTSGCAEDPAGVPTCTLGTITNTNAKQYTIAVTVDAATVGVITNEATAASDIADPDTGDNTATEETLVRHPVNVVQDCWTTNLNLDPDPERELYQFPFGAPIEFVWKHKIQKTCSAYMARIYALQCTDGRPRARSSEVLFQLGPLFYGEITPDPGEPEPLFSFAAFPGLIPPGRYDWAIVMECDDTNLQVGKDGDDDDECGINVGLNPPAGLFPVLFGPAPLEALDPDPGGTPAGRGPGEEGTTRAWCMEVTAPPSGAAPALSFAQPSSYFAGAAAGRRLIGTAEHYKEGGGFFPSILGEVLELETQEASPGEALLAVEVYPNPFNATARIRYGMPEAGRVKLSVYDVLGRRVAVLVDQEQGEGVHEARFEGQGLSAGVYFYRLETATRTRTGPMVLTK